MLGGVFTIGPCDPTVCEPTGACCLVDPNGTVVCFEGPASQCGPDGQFFPDETCDPGPCFLPSTCPSDCNLDGVVDVLDLVSVVAAWGSDDASADINGNGVVEVGDLVRVIEAWGPCP